MYALHPVTIERVALRCTTRACRVAWPALPLLLLAFAMAGCTTTARLNNIEVLSKAGSAYADAVVAVVEQAEDLAIQADSAVLIEARDLMVGAARETPSKDDDAQLSEKLLTHLEEHENALKHQLALLEDISRHVGLLKDYFVALGLLAGAGNADSTIGEGATGLVESMGKISSGLADTEIGDQSLGEFVGTGTPLLVATLRARKLEQQLRRNGQAINRELRATEGLNRFLTQKIRSDDATVQGPRAATAVWEPFTGSSALPEDWTTRRTAFLRRTVDLKALNALPDASAKLQAALAAAAEGHIGIDQLSMLVKDMNALADWANQIDSADK